MLVLLARHQSQRLRPVVLGGPLPRSRPLPVASAELSRHVEKVVGYPPLCDMAADQRREFHDALLDADSFEDLPGRWQAAMVAAEQNRPDLRVVRGDSPDQ
jgi:hypothetical protein